MSQVLSKNEAAMFFLFLLLFFMGCAPNVPPDHVQAVGVGGGQDALVFDLPFADGYLSQCVQGVAGSYSHRYSSTYYDVDLDTPNDSDDPVYAPVAGTAYVHKESPGYGFGIHVNIDLGDGTYLVLGHLSDVLVDDGEEVAAGQLIAVEGTTGYSTGDHVHMGRHEGEASKNGSLGKSIEGLALRAYDVTSGAQVEDLSSDLDCGLSSGHIYESDLKTPLWHPNGTLLKHYDDSKVYLLEGGQLRHFSNESVFWSYNYSFENLVLMDDGEQSCYSAGNAISVQSQVSAVQQDGDAWLLVGKEGASGSYAVRLAGNEPERVLESWGIVVADVQDLPEDSGEVSGYACHDGYAQFRDGTLLSEESSSDVYFVSDGVAMPIADWDTYLLLGFSGRQIVTVKDGSVAKIMNQVGNCSADILCLSSDDLFACGGPDDTSDFGGAVSDDSNSGDDTDTEEVADDLGEGLDWIHVNNASLGLTISDVFQSDVNGNDVAVTGYGFPTDWGYSRSYLVDYDEATDIGWYQLFDGRYRLTMRTYSEWADFEELCQEASTNSELCHENSDGSYSLCLEVHYDEIWPLSDQDCRNME